MISLDISLVWVIINLLVLYLLLKKFLFKPVCKMMDERSAKIQSDLDGAAQAKADAEKIKETLKKKYGVSDVLLEVNTDEALMGGYRLEVNGVEYDKSVQGMIKALQNRISGR